MSTEHLITLSDSIGTSQIIDLNHPVGPEGGLISAKELASRWGCTTAHLANLRSKGQGLPYLRPAGRVLYRMADVIAHEQAVTVMPIGA